MLYDRQIVNLVLEIKRSLPAHLQDDFKLASPDLVDNVKDIYLNVRNDTTRELAVKFLAKAGIDVESLDGSSKNILTRLYRETQVSKELGQPAEMRQANASSGDTNTTKSSLINRGQRVQD